MTDAAKAAPDERIKAVPPWRCALSRPELGGICGTILVFLLFGAIAGDSGMFAAEEVLNWTVVSAQLMIIAVGACLLMIAGEFDLSVGSMIGFSGAVMAILSVHPGWPLWVGILFTFAVCMAIGALNGWLVVRTGLPSFIVTLAFLFILRGLTIWGSVFFTRQTIIGGVSERAEGDWLAPVFGGKALTGLFQWMADSGWIATFSRGSRAGQPIVDGVPAGGLGPRAGDLRALAADADQVRQLDLRRRRRRAGRALRRRAGHGTIGNT
ncbi:hypothetical protein J2Z33_002560 [Rubellimicrobium aerolatum]|nr:hypothetical protein [Rubellimicrobium aerolatum]